MDYLTLFEKKGGYIIENLIEIFLKL